MPVSSNRKSRRKKEILTVSGSGVALPSSPGAAPALSTLRATLSTSSIAPLRGHLPPPPTPCSGGLALPAQRGLLLDQTSATVVATGALPRRETQETGAPGERTKVAMRMTWRRRCGRRRRQGMRRNKRERKSRGGERGWKILDELAELVDLSRLRVLTIPSFPASLSAYSILSVFESRTR